MYTKMIFFCSTCRINSFANVAKNRSLPPRPVMKKNVTIPPPPEKVYYSSCPIMKQCVCRPVQSRIKDNIVSYLPVRLEVLHLLSPDPPNCLFIFIAFLSRLQFVSHWTSQDTISPYCLAFCIPWKATHKKNRLSLFCFLYRHML